jgi:hypothetical protein
MVAIDENAMDHEELITVLTGLLTDITAQKDALDILVAKLNLDAGVTDVDYASSGAITTTAS